MNKSKNVLVAAVATALLAFSSVAQAGFLGDLITQSLSDKKDNGPPGGSATVEKAASFKGVTQATVGQFSLVYFVKNVVYGADSPFSSASGVRAEGEVTGLSPDDYQATADAVYEDFKQQLTAHGITLVDPQAYRDTPARAKGLVLQPGATTDVRLAKADSAEAVVYWPRQLGHNDTVLMVMGGMSNMSRFAQSQMAPYEYAKASGIPVINVALYIDFAAPLKTTVGLVTTSSGQATGQTGADSVTATSRLAVSHYGSKLSVADGKDIYNMNSSQIILQSPISQQGTFAAITGTETNGVTRAVLSLAGMGGGMAKASFKYEVQNPADYSSKVQAASKQAITLFLDQMQALR